MDISQIILQITLSLILPAIVAIAVSLIIFQYKVRFKELHLERAKVIKELWKRINKRYEELVNYRRENNNNIDTDKLIKIAKKLILTRQYFQDNSIYFSDEIATEFKKLYKKLQINLANTNQLELAHDLTTMKKPLEEEFRKMLGVK